MSAVNDNGSHVCSSVPSVGGETVEHGPEQRNSARTQVEQTGLQALALQALQRNTARNKSGTSVFHPHPEKGSNVPPVCHRRMPHPRQLEMICRRAVRDCPDVDPARLQRFLETAEDAAWCSERVARHVARRMEEGLIRENPD